MEAKSNGKITSQTLNRSVDEDVPWEVDSDNVISAEDSSSGRLSAFFISNLRKQSMTSPDSKSPPALHSPDDVMQANTKRVVDAAEKAVLRVADERDQVQKKTFTKWINKHLAKINRQIDNLYEDLRDGHNLIALLEVLSGISLPREENYMTHMRLPREKGRMRFHRLHNVQIALDFLRQRKLRLVNIRSDDITDGNPKLTLGLIWTIILHFQIEDISVEGWEDVTAKQALLIWAKRNVDGYDGVEVTNFTTSWKDGKALNVILHRNKPDVLDMDQVMANDNKTNLEQAFHLAEKEFGVTRLLDADDVDVDRPDERSIITYISSLYDTFPCVPEFPIKVSENDWTFTWEEYRLLTTTLTDWIHSQTIIMRRRDDIDSLETPSEAQDLLDELKRFENDDLPLKEVDVKSLIPKYLSVEQLSLESKGKYRAPEGSEPQKVLNLWQDLVESISDRDEYLVNVYNRLKGLHEICMKINRSTSECHKKLDNADNLIEKISNSSDDVSSDADSVRVLLDSCEADIKEAFSDVQKVKDANYYQAEEMYKTVFVLHERWISARTEFNLALQNAECNRLEAVKRLKTKLEETAEYSRLSDCIKRVDELQNQVDHHVWGNDEPGVQGQIKDFSDLSQAVDATQAPVEQCHKDKCKFNDEPEDQTAYCALLDTLDNKYQQLQNDRSLQSAYFSELLDFVREATIQLVFLHEKEDMIVGQDVANCKPNDLDQQYMNLMGDIEAQESSFSSTTRKGEDLLERKHPASPVIRSYLEAMKDQWKLVLNLSMCMEKHISDLTQHQQFHTKCDDTESWMDDFDEKLDEIKDVLEKGDPQKQEECLENNKALGSDLESHRPVVRDLVEQSHAAPCIVERQTADNGFALKALCSYRGDKLAIAKSEDCKLLDRPSEHHVTVVTSSDQRGKAPAVIFQYAPPSEQSEARAASIEKRFDELRVAFRACSEKLEIATYANKFNATCTSVLAWTPEQFRELDRDEKNVVHISLPRDLQNLDTKSADHEDMSEALESCRVHYGLCKEHVEKLMQQMDADNEADQQCQSYISRLNVLLRRIIDIHSAVVIRIKTNSLADKKKVPQILQEHEQSVDELERCEPHYTQVCSDARSIAQRFEPHPRSDQLKTHIEKVEDGWETTWNVTHVYLNKLKVVMLMGDEIDQTEQVLEKSERFLSEAEFKIGYDELKEQQQLFLALQGDMEATEPTLQSMNDNNEQLKELVDKFQEQDSKPKLNEEIALHSPVRSPDLEVYSDTVEDITERWKVCKSSINVRLENINKNLPKAHKVASDAEKTKSFIERLRELLAKMKELEKTQENEELRNMHGKSNEHLKHKLNDQQVACDQSEVLKHEYDTLQAEVVEFINNETTGDSDELREALHRVQNTWNAIWVVVHVHMEKLKGVVHVQMTRDQCQQIVDEFEKTLKECEGQLDNIAEMDAALQKLQNLIPVAEKYDSNFQVMGKNLSSTKDVVDQLPEDWRCQEDMKSFSSEVEQLEREWEDVKERLQQTRSKLSEEILQLKKANSTANDLNELYVRVAAFNNQLKLINETQNSKILMPLSHEPTSLEKCLAQQLAEVEKVHLLSADYYTLSAECSECRTETKDKSNPVVAVAFGKLCAEEDFMHEIWLSLNDKAEMFKNKLARLLAAVSDLNKFSKTTGGFEDALSNFTNVDGIDKLKQHKQLLTELSSNVPENDSNDSDARKCVDELAEASSELANSAGGGDQVDGFESELDSDAAKCNDDFLDVHERWLKVKAQLYNQINSCSEAIRDKEKDLETEELLSSLLEELKSLLDELKKIESSQTVRADIMLPSDPAALEKTFQQQKNLKSFIDDSLMPRYVETVTRCGDALSGIQHPTSTAPVLHQHLEALKSKWQLVNDLVDTYLVKLQNIEHLVLCLSRAQPLIKTYSGRVADARVSTDGFVEPQVLQQACDKLEQIKSDAAEEQPKIDDVKSAMDSCQSNIAEPCSDQDVTFYVTVCDKLYEDWDAIFKNLQELLEALRNALPEAEKVVAVNKSAEDYLERLEKLQAELDGIHYTVQAWMALTLPSEMEPIQKALEQHKAGTEHTNDVSDRFDQIRSDSEPLLATDTPLTHKLGAVCDKLAKQIDAVKQLNELYSEKLESTCTMMQAVNGARVPLCHYEKQLLLHDTMPANAAQLQAQKEVFEELAADAPKHDPKFDELTRKCDSHVSCLNRIQPDDDTSARMYCDITSNLNERWRVAKDQVNERLVFLSRGGATLREIESKTKDHVDWLEEHEPSILEAVDHSLEDSEKIKSKLNEQEVVQADLRGQCKDLEGVQDLVSEFDEAARGYDQVALAYDPPLPEGVEGAKHSPTELEERSGKRKTIIEYEVITITRKYDKLKNLLSEKVDHYKVDYQKAKDKEDAKKAANYTTTTTEITTTTTTKQRKDIRFPSFLKRKASLHDLHSAGLVSDEMAQQLEMGVLREDEVVDHLRPYLTGDKPIAGLIIKKANNMKVSINNAMKHGLIKTGTGLVLLEAQAATGNVINPLTGELMSVEEAHASGLVDPRYFDALQRAEKAVTGFEDPVTHEPLSLYECMKRGFIVESHGIRLLEAQIATGGLIDPRANHRVPISVAYKRGLFDERMNQILEDPSDDTKGFFDPNTQKNLTYLELMSRCQLDEEHGLLFLVLTRDVDIRSLMRGPVKRRSRTDIRFVTAYHHEARLQDIYDAGLVTEEQVKELEEGRLTESDLENQLKVFLFGGEEPISGVIVEETGETLAIAEAARRAIIKRGTAIELLEAQAATGNIVDPRTGKKMSVDQAYSIGLIDRVHVDTLERAQRAVRGYPEPGTKQILSLFEAMRKGLVVESRGIRLLEAQIATGGLVDPRAHHRVPISVAYKRGLFDERMNQILEDPSDDTKGFFDPNTQENLSYLDLMDRCEIKGEHNLRFLILSQNKKRRKGNKAPESPKKTKPIMTFKTLYNTVVSLDDLLRLGVVDQKTVDLAKQGVMTQSDLEAQLSDNLIGQLPISGVLVIGTKEKLSFLEAFNRNYISAEAATEFLQAQACSGGVVNPKTGEVLSVQDAYMSGMIDRQQLAELDKAESFVLGFDDHGTRKQRSIREMIKKKLLTERHVIKMLQSQLATGGVIEPYTKVRVSREQSVKLGIVDQSLYDLLDSDDSLYSHPISRQTHCYSELLAHCGSPGTPMISINVEMKTSEADRKKVDRNSITFETTLERRVSLIALLEIGLVSEESVRALEEGFLSEEELFSSLRQYLVGEQPIAGMSIEATGQKLGILECIKSGILKRGTGLELLEAQAATGCILDPVSGKRYGVSEALAQGFIDDSQKDTLERAQRAVLGYKDPVSKKMLSLFEAMNKGYVTESRGIRLLEAQIATGGLIDPTVSTRVPLSTAYKRGIINEKMFKILTDPSDDTKGFFDPNTEENLTYLELMSRCNVDPSSGLVHLVLSEKKKHRKSRRSHDEESKKKKRTTHRSRKVVIIDPDTGAELSIKDAYKKGLIDKASARQLLEQEGEWKEEEQLERKEERKRSPRKSTTSESSNAKTPTDTFSLEDLNARLLLLSSGAYQPIAGIVDVKKEEAITIGEAEKRRLVDSTTAQRLFEAQAATGGIIDPNKPDGNRLSINEALARGLIDRRTSTRLANAEKACRGFPDRRGNAPLSLGEAIKRGICYYEAGTRLLEYQAVTGGLIDPSNGSRLTLEESLNRGWIEKRLVDKLGDLSRYSRTIVDLKTNLLMSYADALERSVTDPSTGVRLLEALPRMERNVKLVGGVTVHASSAFTSLASSLASSRAESPVGSRRGSRRGSFER